MRSRLAREWSASFGTAVCASTALCLATALLAGCEREKRNFQPPQGNAVAPAQRFTVIQPGQAAGTAAPGTPAMPTTAYTVEGNAYAVAQGKRLYRWYNCSGCHAPGGGGDWGPALSDDRWLYGAEPRAVFASIAEGRPNGMPSFGSHIPEDQVWQIVAYVRSMSGQLRKDVAPGRADALQAAPPEASRGRETPKSVKPDEGTRR